MEAINRSLQSGSYSEDRLADWTTLFWNKSNSPKWDYYLGPLEGFNNPPPQPLLYIEMGYAGERRVLPEVDMTLPLTLALLVGESLEPLLQAIWVYKPNRLIPLVNKFYGDREKGPGHRDGRKQWDKLLRLIKRLPPEATCRLDLQALPDPRRLKLVPDNPTAVFEHLRDTLKEDLAAPNIRVIVDITGAKKPMIAGAFLFAAYTNAEIAYMDFDRYDRDKGKPYGFSCRPIIVSNPLRDWSLPDWDRVAQLYRQHDFAGALTLLPQTLPVDATSWQEGLNNLHCFLELCHAWENGHLRDAYNQLLLLPSDLQQLAPLAVENLYRYWPQVGDPRQEWLSADFLQDSQALLIYGEEELQRCRRLQAGMVGSQPHQGNRAAFARAYALHETLIKARVVISMLSLGDFEVHWSGSTFDSDKLPNSDAEQRLLTRAKNFLLNSMLSEQASSLMGNGSLEVPWYLPATSGATTLPAKIKVSIKKRRHPNHPVPWLDLPVQFNTGRLEELRKRRNLIIHTYIPVSAYDVTEVVQLAKANLGNFRQHWANAVNVQILDVNRLDVPSWEIVKQTCRLDFIPDPKA